jgi:hypothetical protein
MSDGGQLYRYELRSDDRLVGTGHLRLAQALNAGDRIEIGKRTGIVQAIEPLLGQRELRLVIQLEG